MWKMPIPISIYTTICRHFSSSLPKRPIFTSVPWKYKNQAIKLAQQALTDYLHSTRSLPYTCADQISKNSLVSLSNLVSNIHFTSPTFVTSLQKYLRYHPINELEFFYESIGIDYDEVSEFLSNDKFYISEEGSAINVSLGVLYKEDKRVFSMSEEEVKSRLRALKGFRFSTTSVIGISLAFPFVLRGELSGEVGALFDDLKKVFVGFDLESCVEGNVDAWYEACRKIRVFYDLGCEKGKVLVQKAEYFCKFGVRKEDVGILLLKNPEILDFQLEGQVISVKGLNEIFAQNYGHVFGRNKIANLPHVMRAMELHEWFFNKIKDGNLHLLASYAISDRDEDLDEKYRDSLERIQRTRTPMHTMNKLEFLHAIGFGENALTIKVLTDLHGTGSELQERVDCLLRYGIVFSKLCSMIRMTPKILSQKPEILQQKLNYLCEDMKSSLQYLDVFPSFLCFNLDNRIKPRHRFHMWLTERGLCKHEYSIASIVATSDKSFVARLHMTMAAAYFHPCQHTEGALKLKAGVPGMWTTRGQSHFS
ncbi:mitochondrial transcription termination factor-related family protein [Salix suchowensis]|nr:mitochondrial transcription termination factor-related family protein [Salix suchowensis]